MAALLCLPPSSGLRIGQEGAGTRCVPLHLVPGVQTETRCPGLLRKETEHSCAQRQAQSPTPACPPRLRMNPRPPTPDRAALPALQLGLRVHTRTQIHLHKDTHCTYSQQLHSTLVPRAPRPRGSVRVHDCAGACACSSVFVWDGPISASLHLTLTPRDPAWVRIASADRHALQVQQEVVHQMNENS